MKPKLRTKSKKKLLKETVKRSSNIKLKRGQAKHQYVFEVSVLDVEDVPAQHISENENYEELNDEEEFNTAASEVDEEGTTSNRENAVTAANSVSNLNLIETLLQATDTKIRKTMNEQKKEMIAEVMKEVIKERSTTKETIGRNSAHSYNTSLKFQTLPYMLTDQILFRS